MSAIHILREQPRTPGVWHALCPFTAVVTDAHDPARDAFDGEPDCGHCLRMRKEIEDAHVRAAIVDMYERGEPRDVVPQIWQHADVEAKSRRGEEIERPPFIDWRSALRIYVAVDDEGAGVKSSSEPARFETQVQTSQLPEGDKAQRMAGKLAIVGKALGQAFVAPFYVVHYPARVAIPADSCTEILVAMIVGRRVPRCHVLGCDGSRCEKRKHRKVMVRESWATDERREDGSYRRDWGRLADRVCEDAGWAHGTVTAGHLMAIEQAGGERMDEFLHRRGLVLHRARTKRTEATVPRDDGKLHGWKEIADWLGVHRNTAMEYLRWDPPLPVERFGERVEADPATLKTWREGHTRKTGTA